MNRNYPFFGRAPIGIRVSSAAGVGCFVQRPAENPKQIELGKRVSRPNHFAPSRRAVPNKAARQFINQVQLNAILNTAQLKI
jgi:hypothetical protein